MYISYLLCFLLLSFALLYIFYLKVEKSSREIFFEQILNKNELIYEWLCMKQRKESIKSKLDKLAYINVAVWGIDKLGKIILTELLSERVNIVYCIDDTINNNYNIDVDVYYPLNPMPKVDVVLCITPLPDQWQDISKSWGMPVVNLIDILREKVKKS